MILTAAWCIFPFSFLVCFMMSSASYPLSTQVKTSVREENYSLAPSDRRGTLLRQHRLFPLTRNITRMYGGKNKITANEDIAT